MLRPVTAIGLAVPVPVIPPGLDVTVYPVIAEPPSLAGAVKATVACAFPAVAVPIVGAPGTVEGAVGAFVDFEIGTDDSQHFLYYG